MEELENEITITNKELFSQIKSIIDSAKQKVVLEVNSTMTAMYWEIGNHINQELVKDKRAEYGSRLVSNLAKQLQAEYGSASFSEKNLRRMMQFAIIFPEREIVATLLRQFSWSHFTLFIPIQDELKRSFYMEMCRLENWSVRTLREKIENMLYERTAISKRSDKIVKQELKNLKDNDKLTPDLVFKDPYFLDFLGLHDTYSEKDLENSRLLTKVKWNCIFAGLRKMIM